MTEEILPYRADVASLAAYLEACARGRASSARLRERGLWGKALEGTVVAARALGLVGAGGEELTEAGRRFALGEEAERGRLLRAALRGYAPYAELLQAVSERGDAETDTGWLETWWATRGRGNSPSNRSEGVVTFARLVEAAGWGRFVQGRRGHPTRVEWAADAPVPEVEPTPRAVDPPTPTVAPIPHDLPDPGTPARATVDEPDSAASGPSSGRPGGRTRVVVRLPDGAVARLDLPARLPAPERARLLAMIGSLIEAEPAP